MAKLLAKFPQLRLDDNPMLLCERGTRTPPRTPKTPMTPGSPFVLDVDYFCFRKATGPPKSVIYQPKGHPKQAVVDGEIWPPIFKPRHVRSAKCMQVVDTDLFIATYPKCGTTWLQHICHQLIRGENYRAGQGNEMCVQSPMIERMGGQFAATVPHPRILKTHFNHINVPWSPQGKYIYCVRNPKDCLTSYFHHNRNFKIYNWAHGDFNTFFDLFLSGQLAFGDYFDHLLTWLPHINDSNVLFLTYEEMLADLGAAIKKVGHFIGGEAEKLVEDEEILEKIAENSSIDAMKKDQQRWFPEKQLRNHFIRKGGSRDWKNYFTREQSDRLDAVFRTRVAGTVAENWWYNEMAWELPPKELKDRNLTAILAQQEILDDELESASRRGSFCANLDSKEPLARLRNDRRSSYASLLSAGYGSVWSLNNLANNSHNA